MKKITLLLAFLLTMVTVGYGQVSYEYGFEPTAVPLGGWTAVGFSRVTITPCVETASVRANTYSAANSITSPSLGLSNGGIVDFSFDYKLLNWSANTVATPANQVSVVAQWSNSATGPWFPIGSMGEANHEESTTCGTASFEFSPTPGNLFVKIISNAVNGTDAYVYFDNIILSQGDAPTCVSPSGLVASDVTFTTATIGWEAVSPMPALGYEYYVSEDNETPESAGVATTSTTANLIDLSPNTKHYFWVRSMCTGEQSVWNGPFDFFTGYCIPPTPQYTGYNITGVSTSGGFTNISNPTGTTQPATGYTSFTDFAVTQSPGGEFSYSVSVPSYTNVEIWADLNNNMLFDADEIIGAHAYLTSNATFTGTIVLPADLPLGDYRVRVRSRYYFNTTASACTGAQYGETEDYTLSVIAPPSCMPPTGLTVGNTTASSANLSWTSDGTSFEVQWAQAPFGIGEGTSVLVDTNSYVLTELDADTTYQYYVRQICSTTDSSLWSGPYSFFTGYCAVSVTYTGDYISGFSTTGAVSNVAYTATTNPAGAYVNSSEDVIEQAQGLPFNIALSYVGGGQTLSVWVDWNNDMVFDNSAGSTEKLYSVYNSSGSQTGIITIPEGAAIGNYRMRVRAVYGSAVFGPCGETNYGTTLDYTLTVLPAPECFPPNELTASNLTLDSADLSWNSEGTAFDIEYGEAPLELGGGTTIENVTNNYTLEGLDSDVKYQYYVRLRCEGTDTSFWSGPFTFLTGYCEVSVSYTGDYTSAFSTSGAVSNVTYAATTNPVGSYANMTDDVIEQAQGLSFDFSTTYVGGGFGVNVWVDWNNDLTFDNATGSDEKVFTLLGTNGATKTGNITIPADVEPGSYRLRVRSQYGTGVNPAPCGLVTYGTTIDYTLTVLPAPSCFPPTELGVENTTFESTVLTWTSTGTLFDIEYAEAPFEQGGGTTLENVTNNYLLGSLEADTAYQYYVRQVCTDEQSYWSGPYSFYTGYCVPGASTYSGNLINKFVTLDGFTNVDNTTGTTASVAYYGDFTDMSVSQSPEGQFSYSVTVPSYSNVEVWIDYNNNLVFDADELVGTHVYTTITPSVFTGTVTLPSDLPIGEYRIRVRSRYYYDSIANPCGTQTYGETEDYTLNVIALPSCLPPSDLGVANLATTSVDLTWNSEGTAFEVQWGAGTFDIGQGTVASTTTNSLTLPLLEESTAYQFYVRQNCGAEDGDSLWAGPFKFTTLTPGHIGNGSDAVSSYFPIYSCYGYSYSQQIYLASELQGALEPNTTLITEIRFKATILPGSMAASNNWTVYLGNTAQSVFSSTSNWVSSDDMEQVFSGVLEFTTNEWVTLLLDTPYAWDGTSNLVVGIDENVDSYNCTANWAAYPAGSNRGMMYYSDGTNPDPTGVLPSANYGPNATIAQIQIGAEVDLSTGNFDNKSFTAYPNPVKDILNVSFTQNISDVTVYNLLGQKVLFMNMNANKGQVDMSTLTSGTYLVKVNAENGVKTIKVIKE